MGIVIVVVCVGTGINLALWGALYVRLDGLPLRIWSMAKRERTDGESAALTLLQERTAAKVGAIVKSLREYEEHVAASFRAQVAEAQVRARVVERQSSEAGVALSAASALVRDLRALRDDERAPPSAPPSPRNGLASGVASTPTPSEERLSGDDELTCVSPRRLPGVPEAPVSPTGGGAR